MKIALLAVVATVAAPGYGASVEDSDVARVATYKHQVEGIPERFSREEAFKTLVEDAWVAGEAKELGVVVTDAEVDAAIREDLTPKELKAFLERSGLTLELWRKRTRAVIESSALDARVGEPAARAVTPEQVKAYVDAHPVTQPATRTVRLVAASTRARAMRIQRRLERGATWASVGGYKDEVTLSSNRVRKAIFRAKVDVLTRYGSVVFRVVEETPARPLPRAQQEAQAWEQLSSEAQERALGLYRAQFTEKWRARTSCAGEYVQQPSCGQPPTG
jgi:foldase protein PrsA